MTIMSMRLAKIVPVAIFSLIALSGGAQIVSGLIAQSEFQSAQRSFAELRAIDQLVLRLSLLQKGIEYDILETQEKFEDASATRGLDGLDGGLDQALAASKSLSEKIIQAKEVSKKLGLPDMAVKLDAVQLRYASFYTFGLDMAKVYMAEGNQGGNKLMGKFDQVAESLQEEIQATHALVEGVANRTSDKIKADQQTAADNQARVLWIMHGLTVLSILGGISLSIFVLRRLLVPLTGATEAMNQLGKGNLEATVNGITRKDEIGDLAKAFGNFRQSMIEKMSAERAELAAREQARETRAIAETDRMDELNRTRHVVATLGKALENLANGDLTHRIRSRFDGDYDALRTDFNMSANRLEDAISSIHEIANGIQVNSAQVHDSSRSLSKRTEQQAAALEETASSLDEITVTVKQSSLRAGEIRKKVDEAQHQATQSDEIVRNAILAMGNIEDSSRQISQIINVIDEIAFQTNLLALNAGVEAARAGDAGKGFAVVAQEVRELAQRSSSAAKEIWALIDRSNLAVSSGVSLVNQTGQTLAVIQNQVSDINDSVKMIVTASTEQAQGLSEINAALNQMDQVTQKNAAMSEDATGVADQLAQKSRVLAERINMFTINANADEHDRVRAA